MNKKVCITTSKICFYASLALIVFACGVSTEVESKRTEAGPIEEENAHIEENGVGEIRIGSSVESLYAEGEKQEFRIAKEFITIEGMKEPVFSLYTDEKLVLQVETLGEDTINRIYIKSDHFNTVKGIGVGNSVQELKDAYGSFSALGGETGILLRVSNYERLAFVVNYNAALDFAAPDVEVENVRLDAVIEEVYIW